MFESDARKTAEEPLELQSDDDTRAASHIPGSAALLVGWADLTMSHASILAQVQLQAGVPGREEDVVGMRPWV